MCVGGGVGGGGRGGLSCHTNKHPAHRARGKAKYCFLPTPTSTQFGGKPMRAEKHWRTISKEVTRRPFDEHIRARERERTKISPRNEVLSCATDKILKASIILYGGRASYHTTAPTYQLSVHASHADDAHSNLSMLPCSRYRFLQRLHHKQIMRTVTSPLRNARTQKCNED